MKPRDICLAACPPVFWVIGLTAAKPAVAHFPPIFMMTMVYALAAAALFWTRKPRRTPLWAIFVIAAIGSAIQNAFLFTGLTQLPASTAMLVVQTQVPFAVLAAWVIGKEQLSLGRWIGIVIAFAGVALVIGAPEASSAYLSLAFVVLAGLLWAVSQAMIRVFSRDDGRTLTVALCLFAAPQSLIISLLLEDGQWASLQSASLESWGAFGMMVLFGYIFAYMIWYHLLGRFRIDQVTPFLLLMPPLGVVAGALFLDERISLSVILGAAVIIAGLAVIVRTPTLRAEAVEKA
jgi:O-acetylserine/cysteine efflux transporter